MGTKIERSHRSIATPHPHRLPQLATAVSGTSRTHPYKASQGSYLSANSGESVGKIKVTVKKVTQTEEPESSSIWPGKGCKRPALWINAENDDAVRILVGGEQEVACGIDPKVSGSLSPGWIGVRRALVCRALDPRCIYHDAVVSTVGAVEKSAVRMGRDLSAGYWSPQLIRERGNGLYFFQTKPLEAS